VIGLFNGNIAILKAAIGEITDETNEARAFSLFPICLNTGIIIASFIGGTFANTKDWKLAETFPMFRTYPYALPMILSSIAPIIAAVSAFFFLKETLPPTKEEEGGEVVKVDKSLRNLLTRHITLVIVAFGILSLLGIGIGALVPLFCFTPIEHGGLGMDTRTIGSVISQRSVSTLILQTMAFPYLQKKIGTVRLNRWLMSLWIPTMLLMPAINLAARAGNTILMWVLLYTFMIVGALAGMAFVCNLLLTNAAAPTPQLLGAINGYSQVIACFVGIVGPGGFTSLFAVSVDKNVLGGNLIWLVTSLVALAGAISAFAIKEQDAFRKVQT